MLRCENLQLAAELEEVTHPQCLVDCVVGCRVIAPRSACSLCAWLCDHGSCRPS
jgi:hypothetical protein